MTRGYSANAHNKDHYVTADVSDLRQQVVSRLRSAQNRADPKGAFGRAARAGSDDGMIGGLLFGMLCWAPFMQGIELGLEDAFGGDIEMLDSMQDPTLCAVFDGVSMVADDNSRDRRHRKVEGYPEGRRQDAIMDPIKRKFNMVSANENSRFAYDAHAEVACMSELLDALDDLQNRGVSLLRLDPRLPVYAALRQAQAGLHRSPVMSSFSTPVRKSA